MGVGGLPPRFAESGGFGAHHNGAGRGHRAVVVQGGVLQLGGKNPYSALLEVVYCHFRTAYRALDAECGAQRSAQQVGVVKVSQGIAHNQGIRSGGIAGAHHRAQIAGLLDTLDHRYQRIASQLEVFKPVLLAPQDGNQPLGAFAVGYFGVNFGTYGENFILVKIKVFVGADVRTEEKALCLVAAAQSPADLPSSFQHEQRRPAPFASLLLKGQKALDPGGWSGLS